LKMLTKTTEEIILDYYPYISEKDSLVELWKRKHPTIANMKWHPADEVDKELEMQRISYTFQKCPKCNCMVKGSIEDFHRLLAEKDKQFELLKIYVNNITLCFKCNPKLEDEWSKTGDNRWYEEWLVEKAQRGEME
jgi:hypothetical protein